MKLTIEVTEEDIEKGTPAKEYCCAIALAYRRQTGKCCLVNPISETLRDIKDGIYRLPAEAVRFAEDFDAGYKVEPFSFDIEPQNAPTEEHRKPMCVLCGDTDDLNFESLCWRCSSR